MSQYVMKQHVRKECNCNKEHCKYCDGDLFTCAVCGASEGQLTTECPGRQMTAQELEASYNGDIDFFLNKWHLAEE